jgi:hypothetical protein
LDDRSLAGCGDPPPPGSTGGPIRTPLTATFATWISGIGRGTRRELAGLAAQVAGTAGQALTFAVARERQRGTSWERIAEVLDEDVTGVRQRYEDPVDRLQRRLVEAWLDPERAPELPKGADDCWRRSSTIPAWPGDFDENALRTLLQAARRQLAGP